LFTSLPTLLESQIQRSILDFLRWHGIFCFRVNQQGVPLHDGTGRYRPGPTKGVSDILAIYKGRFIAIEVKRPGQKPTPQQEAFLEAVNEAGGLAFVATSIEDVEHELKLVA
jgi:hypothetical protein